MRIIIMIFLIINILIANQVKSIDFVLKKHLSYLQTIEILSNYNATSREEFYCQIDNNEVIILKNKDNKPGSIMLDNKQDKWRLDEKPFSFYNISKNKRMSIYRCCTQTEISANECGSIKLKWNI